MNAKVAIPEGCYKEAGKGRKQCSNPDCGLYIGARVGVCPACDTPQESKGKGRVKEIEKPIVLGNAADFAGAVKALTSVGGLKGLKLHISRVEAVEDSVDALKGFGGLVNAKAFLIALEGHHD
jgi:hypothetical protein